MSASRPLVWRKAIRESDLDSTARLIAYTLSTWLNGKGRAYPSREEIAAGAGVGVTTVDRALRRLEEAGFLDVERTRGGGYGDNKCTNTYRVLLPVKASQRCRDEWPGDGVTASNRPSHLPKQAESQSHQRHPKTLKTSKTSPAAAAAPSSGAARRPRTPDDPEVVAALRRALDEALEEDGT
jgi:hypothetical protein